MIFRSMATVPTWFVVLTSLVTIVAGLPYVAKTVAYYAISPKIVVHERVNSKSEWVVFSGHDRIVNVSVDYYILNEEDGQAFGSDYQLKSFGPNRMSPKSMWAFKPEDDGMSSETVEITVRTEVRLQDICRLFPSFWGSVELKTETHPFNIAE